MPLSCLSSTTPVTLLTISLFFAAKPCVEKASTRLAASITSQKPLLAGCARRPELSPERKGVRADGFGLALLPGFFFLFLIGNHIQLHRIGVDHFKFSVALGAGYPLALFRLVAEIDR